MVLTQTEALRPQGENVSEAPKQKPFLFIVAFLGILGLVAFSVYLGLQKAAIVEEQNRLKNDIALLQKEIAPLDKQKIQASQIAQNWLSSVEKAEIRWSNVLNRVRNLIPIDSSTQKPKIIFTSYSGSQLGSLNFSAQTQSGKENLDRDIAELINQFNINPFFRNAYVPTITYGETATGEKILTFVFNVQYQDETLDKELQPKDSQGASSQIETIKTEEPQVETSGIPRPQVKDSSTEQPSSNTAPVKIPRQ